MRKKLWIGTLAFLLFIFYLIGLYAMTWHMRINWTIESTDFSVYSDAALTTPWTSPLNLTDVTTDQTFEFYIENDGTVTIDVTVTSEVITGGSASWSPTILTLDPGASDKMTLTLSFTGDGNYDFDFDSTKHV